MPTIERIETIALRVPLTHIYKGSYYKMATVARSSRASTRRTGTWDKATTQIPMRSSTRSCRSSTTSWCHWWWVSTSRSRN